MSIKNPPGGFTFEFGSTLTILTTAATGVHRGKTLSHKGIFTGVVLDEAELEFKRTKHISVSVTGDYLESEDCCEHEHTQSKGKDHDWHKSEKEEDHDQCHKPDKEEDHDQCHKPNKEEDHDQCHKPDKEEDHDQCHKPDKEKGHDKWHKLDKKKHHDDWHTSHKEDQDGKKGGHNCELKENEGFLVLALTSPSFPFSSGQIVWISIEEIVAVAVVCRN